MSNKCYIPSIILNKINQFLSSYKLIDYSDSYDFSSNPFSLPQFSSTKYHVNELPPVIIYLLNNIKKFYYKKLEYPIFLTFCLNNISTLKDGIYVFDFHNMLIQKISNLTDSMNNIYEHKSVFSIGYFIDIDYLKSSSCSFDYIKSIIEIGRLDEFLDVKLFESYSINMNRLIFPTSKDTHEQGIDITKKMLTQTSYIVLGDV